MLDEKFWMESEKGMGSIFYFTLPYTITTDGERDPIIDHKTEKLESLLKTLNTLIVDDDETSRRLLGDLLGKVSEKIQYAKNGLDVV